MSAQPFADHGLAVLVGDRVRAEADQQDLIPRNQPLAGDLRMADLGNLHLGRTRRAPLRFLDGSRDCLRSMALRGVRLVIGTASSLLLGMESRLLRFRIRDFRRACRRAAGLAAWPTRCSDRSTSLNERGLILMVITPIASAVEDLRPRAVLEVDRTSSARNRCPSMSVHKIVCVEMEAIAGHSADSPCRLRHGGRGRGGNIERVNRANIGVFDHKLSQDALINAAADDGRGDALRGRSRSFAGAPHLRLSRQPGSRRDGCCGW